MAYQKDGETINHLTRSILNNQDCTYAVVDVLYEVTVNASKVFAVSATIILSDLSAKLGESVVTSYKVVFTSLQSQDPSITENSQLNGYLVHDPLIVNGIFSIPKYGDCLNAKSGPKFGVSTIFQCYINIEDATQKDCSELYNKLMETYSTIIVNGTEVSANKSEGAAVVPTLITNYFDISEVSDIPSLCDDLPTYLHIRVYHERNIQSGADVTNINYTFEYGPGFQMIGSRAFLHGDLQYLSSDVPKEPCSFCWEDVVEFFKSHQQLMNSLIVIFAGLICFAVPKNFYVSQL